MGILEALKERILFFDGGMGSLLQAQGLKPGELPETWNIKHPQIITQIHRDYLDAGCHIVSTNTFGANGLKYNEHTEYQLEQVVSAAVLNARQAVKDSQKQAYVALDIGPTGKLLKPLGDLDFEKAVSLFRQVITIGAREGADLIIIETMSDSYELKAAVLAAKESCSLPVFATAIFDERGKLLTGGNVASTVALLEGLGVDALGINCGLGPVQMKGILADLLKLACVPVIVNPNAGLPRSEGGKTVYDIDAFQFARVMAELVDMGANVVGGCCGTTPLHMKEMIKLCKDKPQKQRPKIKQTVISSYAKAVVIDKDPVIIGERINPTGKPKFKQALMEHDLEYVLREGISQQDHGAHVLDVNVGLPGIDEAAMMVEVVKELQSITDLPLQIDTANIAAMEQAMRIYNGKPLINSVNGKKESMEAVFPLIKKYGGAVVALCLDEQGIPETADGRVRIAQKIYETAAEYGIDRKDIIIDALCMTVSSDSKGALTTLETMRRIRDEYDGKTILGVSNISFGLPQREIVNATFFTLAMANGLSAAIINPGSEAMMRAYYSFRTLSDLDPQCQTYIGMYGTQAAGGQTGQSAIAGQQHGQGALALLSLGESIEKGLKERAHQAVTELLVTMDSLEVINSQMIPALDKVGKGFEHGTVFLPQLLMSAEAAKAAFEVIKDKMSASGQSTKKKGTIILATVKGDIHDIGKNIVKVLLENYSYDVIDLGKDVDPQLIVDTALSRQVSLVGLSALMTTTVPSMEETIDRLRKTGKEIRVMVGGAVLTPEYAKTIGADRYCRDAMASVKYAEELFLS